MRLDSMRRWRLLAPCALLALVGAGSAPAVRAEATGLYASSVGHSDRSLAMIHYWSRGSLFRSETIIAGHPIITIVNGDFYYILDSVTAIGVAIRRTPQAIAADATRSRPFANELAEVLEGGGEKVRDDVVAGNEVSVYRLTNDSGRRTVWVSKNENQLPLRVETYQRKSGQTGRLEYFNWLAGLQLADSFFEPPAGIRLERFDSYQDYMERASREPVPPAPPLFQDLLHPRSR